MNLHVSIFVTILTVACALQGCRNNTPIPNSNKRNSYITQNHSLSISEDTEPAVPSSSIANTSAPQSSSIFERSESESSSSITSSPESCPSSQSPQTTTRSVAEEFLKYMDEHVDSTKVDHYYLDYDTDEIVIYVIDQDYINRFVSEFMPRPAIKFIPYGVPQRNDEDFDVASKFLDYLDTISDKERIGCTYLDNETYQAVIWVKDQEYVEELISSYEEELPKIIYHVSDYSAAKLDKIYKKIQNLSSIKKNKQNVFQIFVDTHANQVAIQLLDHPSEIIKDIEKLGYGDAVSIIPNKNTVIPNS